MVRALPPRPIDATLSVTKAARMLGVHPNTVRAWSDAGRLRYYRINPRGDRRYRMGDLQRFLATAAGGGGVLTAATHGSTARRLQPAPPRLLLATPVAVPDPDAVLVDELDRPSLEPPVEAVARIATLAADAFAGDAPTLDELLQRATAAIRDAFGLGLVAVWRRDDDSLLPVGAVGIGSSRLRSAAADESTVGRAMNLASPNEPAVVLDPQPRRPVVPGLGPELAVTIPVAGTAWGVLLLAGPAGVDAARTGPAIARTLGGVIALAGHGARLEQRAHRADALRRVSADLASRLDLDGIVAAVVDHALVLFGADRVAVVLEQPDGSRAVAASRGLSPRYLDRLVEVHPRSLHAAALAAGRPLHAVGYRDDPRATAARAAVVQEGYDTLCVAPLRVGGEGLGLLTLHHNRPHAWTDEEIDAAETFATQASVAIRTARNYSQMATWAAQLQSIQKLGARLSRLTRVRDIGLAIATELRQMIDYHNVRVYRLWDEMLVPVAMQGQVGEYVDETPEQLRVRLGEGITGWVALHKVPQNLPDAAKDPRGHTIPGTEDDLDESMLLAPMLHEDQVLGVLVLAKLGLNQFREDDLRLLVIYASLAAQAMANADAAERLHAQSDALERQLRSQRELLQITESILITLDPRAVLDQISERLAELVGYDNISIEVLDRETGTLRPLTARGIHADEYMRPWEVGETGVATWVVEHNEPVLIADQHDDPRVLPLASLGPMHGGLIVVPLRGREGATGVLTVERLGLGSSFTDGEFELVKLFAAQVSIALQNAEVHSAVEIRARTDDLTGLLNHGTFRERLSAAVTRKETFSLVMIDLDEFKRVNDALGHQAGDRLLSEIGAAIVAAGRETDQVFRYGGDEFTLLLPGADGGDAAIVAERVRAAVHVVGGPGTRWHAGGRRVSCSIGVATFPDDGATAASVLLAADRACFVAKRSGAGRIATAEEGLALAAEFSLQEPTPVDPPTVAPD